MDLPAYGIFLCFAAVLRKEERRTLKCQLALTSQQTVHPFLWIQTGPGLSPFFAFPYDPFLCEYSIYPEVGKKTLFTLANLQTHVEYFLGKDLEVTFEWFHFYF